MASPSEDSPYKPRLSVQINQIDYILAPSCALDNTSLPRVPIIRIYGPSSNGQKACLHVHQVYPYFFVEYNGVMNPDNVNRYVARLTHSLNRAIAISLKKNPQATKSQYVRAVILVKGVHFYGFHCSYSPFLKVLLADPACVSRAIMILRSGTVMQTRFRIFEAHLSYPLQFLSDFGLYGCGWIDLDEVWVRGAEDDPEDETRTPDGSPFKLSSQFRQSRMPLEVDVSAHQILNRSRLKPRNIHHKLEIPAPPMPDEPLVFSVRELWDDERQRRVAKGLPPSPEIPIDPSESSRGHGADWVAEARWWITLREKIAREREQDKPPESNSTWERWVMTTFESIEALWEEQYRTWKPEGRPLNGVQSGKVDEPTEGNPFGTPGVLETWTKGQTGDREEAAGDVDESMLSSQQMSQIIDTEEADWEKFAGERDVVAGDPDFDVDDEDEGDLLPEEGPPPHLHDPEGKRQSALPDEVGSTEQVSPSRPEDADSSGCSESRSPRDDRISTLPCDDNVAPAIAVVHQSVDAGQVAENAVMDSATRLAPVEIFDRSDGSPNQTNGISTSTPVAATPHVKATSPLRPCLQAGAALELSSEERAIDVHTQRIEGKPKKMLRFKSLNGGWPSSSSPFIPSRSSGSNAYAYAIDPPSTAELEGSLNYYGVPSKVYQDPYYSKEVDAPERPREYAGLLYRLKGGHGVNNLEDWQSGPTAIPLVAYAQSCLALNTGGWEYAGFPPSARETGRWLKSDEGKQSLDKSRKPRSQIEGPTQANIYHLKTSPIAQSGMLRERQDMTILACEVFVPCRDGHVPDADVDSITAIFYAFQDNNAPQTPTGEGLHCRARVMAVQNASIDEHRLRDFPIDIVTDELELLNSFIDIVLDLDPDVLTGWNVQASSWGFLNARGGHYGLEISDLIARAASRNTNPSTDQWGLRKTSTFKVTGRHVLNLWRIMRMELTLNIYTMENVVFHSLRRRIARYHHSTLTQWYRSDVPSQIARMLNYFLDRTIMVLDVLDASDTITKNAEFARVFGVDFFSVISRGSQFKVESFMFRIAKPESFVLISPSKEDVGKQNAAECMPLIMEPQSAFYNSPLVVLDFQSLYPSVMIAYNYCYSTCLGRIADFKGRNKFGVVDLHYPPGFLERLESHVHVAPNGMLYVKPEVRKGLLAKMLIELLDTRVMVKQAMKGAKNDKALRRILDARQLGLKFIANVTYGYTSASYSGRMPAVEIADSIVQSGRETLEKAVRLIDANEKWGAKVVYGDTDSLFIYLRGKTKQQAFVIGQDMADTVTALNPAPIKLKFEKVYLPCVLMAKKRYVGFKYEHPDETEAAFDAKGIETVRRDGIPAQQKMTETCLKILFRTQDLSNVKEYCCHSWFLILNQKVSMQDFIFAKEVRMGTYSDKGPPPPGVTVAARRIVQDHNDEPQYGERVPYVIVRGEPYSRLVDRALDPLEALSQRHYQLDAVYYITRVLIPPLERIFNLVGADVRAWYDEMPKPLKVDVAESTALSPQKRSPQNAHAEEVLDRFKIDDHFLSTDCLVCGVATLEVVCDICRQSPEIAVTSILFRLQTIEKRLQDTHRVCVACTSSMPGDPVPCNSTDCPWFFERTKAEQRAEAVPVLLDLIRELEAEAEAEESVDEDLSDPFLD